MLAVCCDASCRGAAVRLQLLKRVRPSQLGVTSGCYIAVAACPRGKRMDRRSQLNVGNLWTQG